MKYLAIILIIVSFGAKAQIRYPTGFPTQTNTGWNKWGYPMADSGLIVANRDTNWLAKYSGTVVFRPNNKKFYYFDSTNLRWFLLAGRLDTAYNGASIEGNGVILGGTLDRLTDINNGGFQFFLHGEGQNIFRTQFGNFQSNVLTSTVGSALTSVNTVNSLFSEVNSVAGSAYIVGGKIGTFYNEVHADSDRVFLITKSNTTPKRLILDTLGYMTLDAYPSLTQETDTTTYKPIGINSAGKTVPMAYWKGSGGAGAGLTSVGISMPSGFTVTNSPLVANGTIAVSGAGTTLQYLRGNGTLATFDTTAIPNFYLKVRGLLTGTSPITFNQTTGAIGINNANTSGTKGAASFTGAFFDNGSGLIDLLSLVTAGSCTNCNVTFDAKGRATAFANGSGGAGAGVDTIFRTPGVDSIYFTINSTQYAIKDSAGSSAINNTNITPGFRWLIPSTQQIKGPVNSNTIIWDSTSTANALTAKADTSVLATQYDLTQVTGVDEFDELLDVAVTSPKNGQVPVYDSITSKWRNRYPVYYNVKDYGAVGDSTTDDRAAIIKARDAAYTAGGVLFFPAGKYRISDSILFIHPIRIQGVGKSGGLHNNQSGGVLPKDRLGPIQTSTEIVVTDGKNGFVFEMQSNETKATPAIEYVTMSSTVAPGSATGGAFIVVRQMLQGFSLFNCTFYGGYIQVDIQSGYYQYITGCHFSAPKKAGLKTANNIRTDTGDFTVTGCVFSSGTFSTLADTTRAIWWTSGGGMRVINNKFDACEFDTSHAFRYDIYATNILDPTSVFIIADNSIENYTVSGIYLHGIVSPYVRIIQINNNEFTPVGSAGPAIDIDQMEAVSISEFIVRDWSGVQPRAAVKVTNTNGVVIAKGRIDNFSSNFDLTGSTNTHVDYMWGGDVAIGSLNTTNIAAVSATLYTTETILGRATSGQFGGGILELATQVPDQDGGDVGFLDFSTTANTGSGTKRVAAVGATTNGSTANNRGGKLSFYTKINGSSTFSEQMSVDNAGVINLNSGYSLGTITGTPAYMLGVTSAGKMVATTGSSQWTTTGSDIYFNTGNTGLGDATPDVKLDIETASTGSDGIIITNTNSGAAARPIVRLLNDAGELGQFGMMSSTHATLPNYTLFEATKSLQFGTDQGIASGGSAVINFVTGGFSVAPSFIIKSTGVLNGSSLAGSGTRMVVAGATGDLSTQAIPSSTTLYSGDGTLSGDRVVTGSGNDLTFASMFDFRINANTFLLAKASPGAVYTTALTGAPNLYQVGYTPVPTVYSKGAGLYIDTNNNVGLGSSPSTTLPLYATGRSTVVAGFQSTNSNFYLVEAITSDITANLSDYYFRIDATGGNITITLPAASTAFGTSLGIHYVFKRIDNSGNAVTITRAGSDTIDGATSITLTTQWEGKELQCSSTSTWDVK